MIKPGAESLALFRPGIVRGIEIVSVGGAIPGDLHDDRIGVSPGKMVDAAGFRVDAARRKRLERRSIEPISIAEVPLARHYSCHAIIAVGVRLDRGMRRHVLKISWIIAEICSRRLTKSDGMRMPVSGGMR
jgi:hypothetical protein